MDEKHEKHIELHSKVLDCPIMAPMFGYWKFDRFYQKFWHWLKTGIWPKRQWVDGLLTFKKHIEEHDKYRWCE